jgi:hypothetical protein
MQFMGAISHPLTGIKILTTCAVVFPLLGMTSSVQQEALPEYQVKAVFLYNFAQFVEWPATAFPDANAPLIIGVLGNDPFGNYLDETIKDEKVNEHPLDVRRFRTLDDIKTCHILFISASESNNLRNICSKLKSNNILTVSDASNFTKQGGMVRFFTENNKTRIRINLKATKTADLVISSKLLRLADIVNYPIN